LVTSRVQGPVGGTGEPMMVMKYVATEEDVKIGEKIVTSGMDKIFPRDIPIGTVVEVKAGNPFKQIQVQPAAKLDRLETVLVLLTDAPVEYKTETSNTPAATQQSDANPSVPATKSEKP
jgi:rod shape-determining protein MreC